LGETDLQSDTLNPVGDEENAIYYHFKVIVGNTARKRSLIFKTPNHEKSNF